MNQNLEILKWIKDNKIRTNKNQDIEFSNHRFLLDMLLDWPSRLIVRKPSQVGVSLTILLKVFFQGGKKTLSSIYTLPTNPEAREFVLSKVDPLIENSPGLRTLVQKVPFRDKPLYSTTFKRIGGSFYFFRGSWAVWKAQSIDCDILTFDEIDLQKPEIMSMYRERLTGSSSENIVYSIGNPSIPGFGISELYENSDQREWFVKCSHCQRTQVLSWPDSIDVEKGIYVCKFCHRILYNKDRINGQWIAKFPSRTDHGYAINRLMAAWISAKNIIEMERVSTTKHFYNYCLGLPFIEHGDVLTFQTIRRCLVPAHEPKTPSIVMGIDQGDLFHVIIGDAGQTPPLILDAKIARSKIELEDILNYYKPAKVVMDMLPSKHLAKELQEKWTRSVFLLGNLRDFHLSQIRNYIDLNRSQGLVNIERTESLDRMIDRVKLGKKGLAISDNIFHFKTLAEHLANLIPDFQDRYGRLRKVWKNCGPDDFAHSLNFFLTGCTLVNPELAPLLIEKDAIPEDDPKKQDNIEFERLKDRLGNSSDVMVIPPIS